MPIAPETSTMLPRASATRSSASRRQPPKRRRARATSSRGGHAEREHVQQQARGHELARLAHVGLQHVLDHGAVDHDAVDVHEVGGDGRHEQQEHRGRLPQVGQREEPEHEAERDDEDPEGAREEGGLARRQRCQRAPERRVARERDEERHAERERERMRGAA